MNKRQKEVFQHQLKSEKAVLAELEKQYKKAMNDIDLKIRILESDELTQSRIYRLEHQKALKAQVQAILDKLHADEYTTIEQFLSASYTDGFLGTMYDMHGQGVPLIFPIDPKQAVEAVMTESKLSVPLYDALGVDTKKLTKTISSEISRGIASDMAYTEIARNIANASKAPLSRAKTIVQTESHRIQEKAGLDAQRKAKDKGADVLKQWNSTLDGETRPTHRKLDGQVREIEEPFEMNGLKAMYPGDFGDPAEDCNCRCRSTQRARWALGEEELQTLKDRAEFFGVDKTDDFEDFKKKYLRVGLASGKPGDSDGYTTIDEVVPFDFTDKKALRKEINRFAESFSKSDVEHALVFSPDGNLYKLTGSSVNVNTELVGADALVGSISVHNHPVFGGDAYGDSFSKQDVMFAIKHKVGLNILVSGNKTQSFVYSGKLSAAEIGEEYEKAVSNALEVAFENQTSVEYWQEAALRNLAASLEGFEFNEDI